MESERDGRLIIRTTISSTPRFPAGEDERVLFPGGWGERRSVPAACLTQGEEERAERERREIGWVEEVG